MGLLENDPVDLLLDDDSDIVFGTDGDLQFSVGLDGVARHLQVKFRLFKEEWFFNLDAGFPYLAPEDEAILGEKPDLQRAHDVTNDLIFETPGVLSVVSLVVDFDGETRGLTIDWKADTVFGLLEGTETLP